MNIFSTRPGATVPGPCATLAIDPMLDIREVEVVTKQKKSAWYVAIKEGRAPAPYRVGARRVAWKASEIQTYLDNLQRVDASTGSSR